MNVKIPKFGVVRSVSEVNGVIGGIGECVDGYVVKAQILGGGRGLGYFRENQYKEGVRTCKTVSEAGEIVKNMLGNHLVTVQTGASGRICNAVMITERVKIERLFYLGMLINGAKGCYTLIGSKHGGTSIEETARTDPNAIKTLDFDTKTDWTGNDEVNLKSWISLYNVSDEHGEKLINVARVLTGLFKDKDCTLLEVNPLVLTEAGDIIPVDIKMNFDDNAEYRHGEIFKKRDFTQEDPREVNAGKYGLNYIGLDGNIGCMVNGAGLAMATMDLLSLHGGSPANFLDIGGGADRTQVIEALRILNDDKNVSAIFVNIFGGIMRCDIIASGMIGGLKTLKISKPIVIRLQGTHRDIAKDQLNSFKNDNNCPNLFFEEDFNQAAKRAVAAA